MPPDDDPLAAYAATLAQGIEQITEGFRVALAPIMEALSQSLTAIAVAARRAYEDAGSPYGLNDAGVLLWFLAQAHAQARANGQADGYRNALRKLGVPDVSALPRPSESE